MLTVSFPTIYTEAEDMKSLKETVKDVVLCHFDKENTPKLKEVAKYFLELVRKPSYKSKLLKRCI